MRAQVADSLLTCEGAPDLVRARFRFAPELSVFAGHFPGRPLVPGVFLIEATRLVGERALGRSVRISRVQRAKFSAEVAPGADVEVTAALDGAAPAWHCAARLATPNGPVARVDLDLEEAP